MHKKSAPADSAPCPHVANILPDLAMNRAKGWRKLLATAHTATCPRCAAYVQQVKEAERTSQSG